MSRTSWLLVSWGVFVLSFPVAAGSCWMLYTTCHALLVWLGIDAVITAVGSALGAVVLGIILIAGAFVNVVKVINDHKTITGHVIL